MRKTNNARIASVAVNQTNSAVVASDVKCLFHGIFPYRASGAAVETVTIKNGAGTTVWVVKVDSNSTLNLKLPEPIEMQGLLVTTSSQAAVYILLSQEWKDGVPDDVN